MGNVLDGLIGAAIGAVLTFIIGLSTTIFSYHDLFARTVSNSRNEWINIWRDEISNFLAISDILRYETFDLQNKEKYLDFLKEYHVSKNKILMRLNLNEKRHQEIYLLINSIAYEKKLSSTEYCKLKESLMAVSRDLLKDEWERVKQEAKGKRKNE